MIEKSGGEKTKADSGRSRLCFQKQGRLPWLTEQALIKRYQNEHRSQNGKNKVKDFHIAFTVSVADHKLFADGRPSLPTGQRSDDETAEGHHEVRADIVEQVEEIATAHSKATPDAEGKSRHAAQKEERRPVHKDGFASRQIPFVLHVGRDHFEERDCRRQSRNQQTDIEEEGKHFPERDVREDHRNRDENQTRTAVGFHAEGKHGGHDHETGENRGLNGQNGNPETRMRHTGFGREIGTVGDQDPATQREREEGKAHGVENGVAREVFPLEIKEVFHTGPGSGQRQSAHNDGEHQNKEHRHQIFRDAFNPGFDSKNDDAARDGEEGQMPGDITRAIGHQIAEMILQHLRVGNGDTAAEGVPEIGDTPTADDGVVGENHERGEHTESPHDGVPRSPDRTQRRDNGPAALTADGHFCHNKNYANSEGENNVRNNEGGAAVGTGPEGEFPYCTEADSRPRTRQDESDARAPL